ncbi:MAG: PAS domain S-box protein [Nitrospirae bacterium]|nr:PAS domain S-box protein [Nitrospirota bacterium]
MNALIMQMDYIFFFYGFAFIILGAVCFILIKEKLQRLPWVWLGLFGFTHGVHEWLDLFAVSLEDSMSLRVVRLSFTIISFLFLTEFGRAGVAELKSKGTGRWIFVPLAALASIGGFAGLTGLEASSRYVLGLTGGLWASLALVLVAKQLEPRPRRWLTAGGLSLGLYAVSTGVIVGQAGFFPASVLNSNAFLQALGFPIQLLRGILAIFTAFSIWVYSQVSSTDEYEVHRIKKRYTFLPGAVIIIILAGGWALTGFLGRHAAHEVLETGHLHAETLSGHLNYVLRETRHTADVKARSPLVVRALLTGSPRDMETARVIMNECKDEADRKAPFCSLQDTRNNTILHCNRKNGNSLPDKFHLTEDGGFKSYFSFDAASKVWRYHAIAPVKDEKGNVLGSVVIREDMKGVEEFFKKHEHAFLVDPDGIIFLSSSECWCLKSLWPLKGDARKNIASSGRFGPGPFDVVLPEEVMNGMLTVLDGKRFLVTRRTINNEGRSIVLLSPTRLIAAYRLFAIFSTFVISGLTIVFFSMLYLSKKSASQIASSEQKLLASYQMLVKEIGEHKAAQESLKESEAKFRNIYEDSPIGIEIYDSEGSLLDINRAGMDIFGIPDTRRVKGFKLFEDPNISEDVRDRLLRGEIVRFEAVFDFDRVVELDLYNTSKSGRMYINLVITPIRPEAENKFSGYLVQVQDITSRKLAEAEALRTSHLAALGELAAGVAHEINNPVNGIINYAQLLFNKLNRGTAESDIAGMIIKEGDRIADIVSSLLSFAREKRKFKRPVGISEILSESLKLTDAQLKKDGIILKTDVPPELPQITANLQQLQQVFLNILSNARYALNQKYPFAHEDKIIGITAAEVPIEDRKYIRVIFEDHGTGMSDGIFNKVLNPFFTTKPDNIGTGLGLSISHGIIRDHGGRLTLESREGEFTKVIIDLPVHPELRATADTGMTG